MDSPLSRVPDLLRVSSCRFLFHNSQWSLAFYMYVSVSTEEITRSRLLSGAFTSQKHPSPKL